ncbi:MAG: ATP-binding protein [Gemmatimonadota bacterium]
MTGSESTGKTTLATELAAHFRTLWTPEFARGYAEARGGFLTALDVEPIARGQMAVEDAAFAIARTAVFHDTDLLSTWVYAGHYYGLRPEWLARLVAERRADLYLLADVDLPWQADGVRDRPAERSDLDRLFRDALEKFGCRYEVVRGTRRARLESALEAIGRSGLVSEGGRAAGL